MGPRIRVKRGTTTDYRRQALEPAYSEFPAALVAGTQRGICNQIMPFVKICVRSAIDHGLRLSNHKSPTLSGQDAVNFGQVYCAASFLLNEHAACWIAPNVANSPVESCWRSAHDPTRPVSNKRPMTPANLRRVTTSASGEHQFIAMLETNIDDSIAAQQALRSNTALKVAFASAAMAVVNCYQGGGRLYIAGNGGSAADAQHLAAEFISKLARDRNPLPAEALTTDSSILTAIGNDYGFEFVFSRQIMAKLGPNDVFLGITTSGHSKNIVEALKACKERQAKSIVLAGRDGGPAAHLADHVVIVPGHRTSTIQELQIVLAHSLCEAVESIVMPA
jgi:D-sedoheptulose 7-phosphate isomerase